jgi:hypothetical protein
MILVAGVIHRHQFRRQTGIESVPKAPSATTRKMLMLPKIKNVSTVYSVA